MKLRSCGFINWKTIDPVGSTGGLTLAWMDNVVVQIIDSSDFFIVALVKYTSVNVEWNLVGVHFSSHEQICSTQFQEVLAILQQQQEIEGSPMFRLAQKFKLVRHRLVIWQRTGLSNSEKQIDEIIGQLEEMRASSLIGGLEIMELEQNLKRTYLNEEFYWKDKSRIKWLKEGDKNTSFFHQKFEARSRKNKIWRLKVENKELATSNVAIARVAVEYFKGIFTSTNQADSGSFFLDFELKVTTSMNHRLQRPVSFEEVKKATFSVHPYSAPREDEITAKFFQFYWDSVGDDVFKAVRSFFRGRRILRSFNHTNICLIPKIPDACDMSQV
ncbi:uncharacterized protein [Arachis hypogaea]|uniref:uncharacterized protein n=1 Tax=Arachis hypogaea TaxID=3818 RepID=UPI003B20C787